MIMSGGSKQPRCLPRCDRFFSVLFRRSSSAVVCLLVKRLSHGRKSLQPCCCCRNSQRTQFSNRPPCGGAASTLPPPASLPAAVRLNDLRIVPSGVTQAQFPVLFPRNGEHDVIMHRMWVDGTEFRW